MKDNKKSEFKIGVVVLLAALILIFGILWGKRVSLSGGGQEITVYFKDILGVEVGSTVLVNGIKRGKVDRLDLKQDGVDVLISLEHDVKIYNDAVFEITTPELMSGKVINIYPGASGEMPPEGYVFKGLPTGDMASVMRSAGDFIEDLRTMLGALKETIYELNRTIADTTIRKSLIASAENLNATSEEALAIARESRKRLSVLMSNLVESSQTLSNLLEENTTRVNDTVEDLDVLASNLRTSAERLNQFTAKIEAGDGTIGMMLNDQDFADKLNKTINDLDSLIVQIQKKGIKTKISLF